MSWIENWTEEFAHGAKMKKSATVTTTARFAGCHLGKMVPTIITTNLTMSELAEENVLGRRIVSRLCEMTSGVIVKAGDYRLKNLAGDRA